MLKKLKNLIHFSYTCNLCNKQFADCSNLKKHKINNCLYKYTADADDLSPSKRSKAQPKPEFSAMSLLSNESPAKTNLLENVENINEIIDLSYQKDTDNVLNENHVGLHVIDSGHQYITAEGANVDPVIFTISNDLNKDVIDASGDNSNENLMQISQSTGDLLYHLQPQDVLVTDGENFNDQLPLIHQTQSIGYILVDGRKMRLINYNDSLDLESEYALS